MVVAKSADSYISDPLYADIHTSSVLSDKVPQPAPCLHGCSQKFGAKPSTLGDSTPSAGVHGRQSYGGFDLDESRVLVRAPVGLYTVTISEDPLFGRLQASRRIPSVLLNGSRQRFVMPNKELFRGTRNQSLSTFVQHLESLHFPTYHVTDDDAKISRMLQLCHENITLA